ncbi:hypothetical protein [Zhongshania marina]|uniref:AttH domain-containing protein n=1 Tax=Zhongshania marina TaxID=2304603 RepID=A0A2S4HJ48_9GAMM|nr:hypothetical protein [Marortus luteolus]POP54003.1 hypothetical protein C0068_03960 [Marortus luteolus]
MLSEQELTQFGVELKDEFSHPYSQNHDDWNESYFFDWYTDDGSAAGHCRIGWHPVQQRILFWLHLWNGSEWLLIEENRLPFSALKLGAENVFSYDQWGLKFSYDCLAPLQSGRLQIEGFARVAYGPRQGMILPVNLALEVKALGAAYSRGAGSVEGHSAQGFSTNRYEQPIQAFGQMAIDGCATELTVRGERDHSWGPRPWDMNWQFFVVNNEKFSLQATQVEIPEWPLIQIGYFHEFGQGMEHLSETKFELEFASDQPFAAVSGRFSLLCESGRLIAGRMESIAGSEIDITHAFTPPKRTEYRRTLIRCYFDSGEESVGWLEYNRPKPDNK